MEVFEVYNRKNNTWKDDKIGVISGWNENFVLDKTTDTAKVKLKYNGLEFPDWKINDWCRILHLNENETKATYSQEVVFGARNIDTKEQIEFDLDVDSDGYFLITVQLDSGSFQKEEITARFIVNYFDIKEDKNFDVEMVAVLNEENNYRSQITWGKKAENTEIGTITITQVNPETLRSTESVWIPKNHEQYIIKNITMVQDFINEEIDIQLDLAEPINYTAGILCETMSFTNQVSKKVDNINYVHDALTHLSVLEKILKVTPANTDSYEAGYNPKNNKSWFNRIKIVQSKELNSLPFNDETLSEPSLYDILMNKYDSSVGMTPVLYFDINKNTDLPNNPARPEFILKFERQDGFDKEEISLDEIKVNAKEVFYNTTSENFSDGLISNYDNLAPNSKIYAPAETLWLVPEIDSPERSTTKYVDSSEFIGSWVLKTPHLIKKVVSVKRFYLSTRANTDEGLYYTNREVKTFETDAILEEKEYNASTTYFNSRNCVWYKEGTNIIHLNEAYYKQVTSSSYQFDNLSKLWIYKVEYEPLVSGRFDLGAEYQTQINQYDSQIDNEKFGKYLKEYLASMNKADLVITCTVENFADIKDIGTRVYNNYKNYIITTVAVQNRGDLYDAVYQLNENHIRKSDTIQAPQEIRKNIEIGIDATKERKSMLNYNVGISYKLAEQDFYKTELSNKNLSNVLKNMFTQLNIDESEETFDIQLAKFNFKSKLYRDDLTSEDYVVSRLCEIASFYMNNTICLNMKYFDNAEAGKSKNLNSKTVNLLGAELLGMPSSQIPELYTNPFGEFDTFDVEFLQIDNKDIVDIVPSVDISSTTAPTGETQRKAIVEYLNKVNKAIKTMGKYPLTTSVPTESLENPVASINGVQYYKDMLDAFNYTIGFHYKTSKDIILCDAFFKNSKILNSKNVLTKYRIYDTNVNELDVLNKDWVGTGTLYNFTEEEVELGSTKIRKATYRTQNNLDKAKSIVLFSGDSPVLIINNFSEVEKSFSIFYS